MDKISATNVTNILHTFYFFCCVWTDIDLIFAALLSYVTIITRCCAETTPKFNQTPSLDKRYSEERVNNK